VTTGGHAGRGLAAVRRIAAVAAVAVLAAGCGGDDTSSAESWANDVCTAFSDWRDAVASAGESLRTGPTTGDDLEAAVDELEQATEDFADELRDLGPPETDAGQEAQDALDRLADDVDEDRDDIRTAVDGAEGVQGVLEAATAIASILSVFGEQLGATFDELEQIDPAGELSDAFESSEACASLSDGG
jgi:hypothetical protein